MKYLKLKTRVTVLAVAATSGGAAAQWTVTSLHPSGAANSYADAVYGDRQVGRVYFGGIPQYAAAWQGSAESWVNLNPPGATYSYAYGVHGGQQVGQVGGDGIGIHACLWNGSAGSWVDLHPSSDFVRSRANATDGSQQVGYVWLPGSSNVYRASVWSGTAASWVNLHPAGTRQSEATGVHDGQQVGWVAVSSDWHQASLWSGSAVSWVNLQPTWALYSEARGVHEGTQVGWASTSAGPAQAGIWRGSAASWRSLHPAGFPSGTHATAIHGQWQAGYTSLNRACIWHGSAESWADLHHLLPGSWSSSYATGIWSDESTLSVVGYGFNSASGRTEALLWTRSFCLADYNREGDEGDVLDFLDFMDDLGSCVAQPTPCGEVGNPDVNGDTVIDVLDFLDFMDYFGTGC